MTGQLQRRATSRKRLPGAGEPDQVHLVLAA
jgi:hypothetical protein